LINGGFLASYLLVVCVCLINVESR